MKAPWIDPELQYLLETTPNRPPLTPATVEYYRTTRIEADPKPFFPNAKQPTRHRVDAEHGAIDVYEFRPSEPNDDTGALLWLHGGGYVMGHGNDAWFGTLFAESAGVRVFSVDYRLAPEYPYPAALDDAWAVLNWMADEAQALGISQSRIAIGGASAGGGLAAGLALHNRDLGGPEVAFQLLLYPMLDHRHDTASGKMNVPRWPRATSLAAWDMYLAGKPPQAASVPAVAKNLSGLPPAFLTIGEADLFLDDIRTYATRLTDVGVSCQIKTYPGVFHGAEIQGYSASIGQKMTADYVQALQQALAKTHLSWDPLSDTESPSRCLFLVRRRAHPDF